MIVKIISVFSPDGSEPKRTVIGVDLASDLWEDFRHYIAEAKGQEGNEAKSSNARNRAVRGAIWSLCSHLEGVVSGLHRWLRSKEPEFSPQGRRDGREGSLFDQVLDLRRDADRRKGVRLKYLELRLKLFRDILAHPGIEKDEKLQTPDKVVTFPGGQPELRLFRSLSEFDLYFLRIADIEADAEAIDRWLNRLCKVYKYPRFPDMKQALEEALRPYGGGSSTIFVHKT